MPAKTLKVRSLSKIVDDSCNYKENNYTKEGTACCSVLQFWLWQADKYLHVSFNISKESHVTLKIDKRLHLETVFHMATVNTMFSIRGQEELSMKSYSYKFS